MLNYTRTQQFLPPLWAAITALLPTVTSKVSGHDTSKKYEKAFSRHCSMSQRHFKCLESLLSNLKTWGLEQSKHPCN